MKVRLVNLGLTAPDDDEHKLKHLSLLADTSCNQYLGAAKFGDGDHHSEFGRLPRGESLTSPESLFEGGRSGLGKGGARRGHRLGRTKWRLSSSSTAFCSHPFSLHIAGSAS